ncbi:hypothetical protein ACRE_065730 [Hapsidospora chrysogenum ATCC 11550]|uniref:Rad21/Rec8-like protein C-terminal eukaryotic domain-containing protein n=1 Tax=Hapsidospora chrysogenum (strain ATCC 11550 / CBS 779.69 / DSM 880 / IAM 14645 / JCM 23072 / IMI 49137) TaxID=857340 RepID=A0A086T041_HAPC1|nr:hypothetical protein ACRE_065730 [Hapsidospora chrysogenum ATCC 11550]
MARHQQDADGWVDLGDDAGVELGMRAANAMDDRHSSTMMPWSRPNSVVPGSSVRGSAQKAQAQPAPSPLFGHGRIVPSIERHSDEFGSDDRGGQIPVMDSDPMEGVEFDLEINAPNIRLDTSSQQFLAYAMEQAEKADEATDAHGRRWVEFQQLANPDVHDKQVAAQAFLHVLTLASMGAISVDQDGAKSLEPFGDIHIGIPASIVEQAN